nr:uncharacterized protein LOC124815972 [Hydra vulgaris]
MPDSEKEKQNIKTELCKKWIHASGRKSFNINNIKKDTCICSLHFLKAKSKQKAETSDLVDFQIESVSQSYCGLYAKNDFTEGSDILVKISRKLNDHCNSLVLNESNNIIVKTCDQSTQTIYDKHLLASEIEIVILKRSLDNSIRFPSTSYSSSSSISSVPYNNFMPMEYILSSEVKCKYFIGLTSAQFSSLYDFLGPAKFNLFYWNSSRKVKNSTDSSKLSLKEQLFVTLLRLRRGFNIFTLAHMYNVKREVFKRTLPKEFRTFKKIRATIDCTEFRCEVPRNYAQQGNTYSSYKHHCTMKCLIAVNPNGAACFVSDLCEGSITDVDIFNKCGIMKHINPEDIFLVDKGFKIQHLLLEKEATLFIPTFLGKGEKFTAEEIMLTKKIAKARIHIERFNERLKKFRMIDCVIPQSLTPIAPQLVFVASCLVNFQDCLCV